MYKQTKLQNFLSDVAIPLINYLQGNTHNFVSDFESICKNNNLFQSWKTSPTNFSNIENQIFELTDNYLIILSFMSDYVGCDCHKKSEADLQQEFDDSFKKYVNKLLQHIEKDNFLDFLLSSDFNEEYTILLKHLLNGNINLAIAENLILDWKNKISDDIFEKVLLNLRYSYIKKLVNK